MVIGRWAEKKCETTQLAFAKSSLKNWVVSVDVGSTSLEGRNQINRPIDARPLVGMPCDTSL
ncbi:hypothetical protein K449DRAFT_383260 [Hypoxylon sp. EC38]|nr:hypothetical protein K449DRAFT_383260 [Hypoxylon sp. EC38]